MRREAVILCSGGLDSVVTAYWVARLKKYGKITVIFFNYGQESLRQEKKFSRLCARKIRAQFYEIHLPPVPGPSTVRPSPRLFRKHDLQNLEKESKRWYVPCRNTLFLTHALAYVEKRYVETSRITDIFVGFKCEGNDSYPDTTKHYIAFMNRLAHDICAYPFSIKAPFITKDKEDIIALGKTLGVDFTKTVSCYRATKDHCGRCMACALRHAGFYWANVPDPTRYVLQPIQ